MTLPLDTPPYLHDRWDDQVALEQEMLAAGRQRMQDRINKAVKKKDMSRLRPYRSLIKEFIEPVSANLKEWLEAQRKRRGPKAIAYPRLLEVDPDSAALVALRTVFRLLGIERRLIMGMAVEIGTWVEHEVRAAKWAEADPESWGNLDRYYKRRGANSAHLKRARVVIFNKHIKAEIGYEEWTEEERTRVGLQMLDCVVQGTGRFRVVADSGGDTIQRRIGRDRGRIRSHPMALQADDGLMTWLKGAMDDEMVFWPVYLPTLIPPKPWDGPRDGGYWTPFVKAPFLIRFKAAHQDQKQRAIDEYMALDMPQVYAAINYVQDTPWKINEKVLEVAQAVWDKDLALAGIPRQEEEQVPARPAGAENDKELFKAWAQDASEVRTRNAKLFSRFIGTKRALNAAERFRNEPCFYFPHMLDFRGRMYPIPSDLSPQGEDLHRGLLTFAEGKPVGEHGSQWLSIQLANNFGIDKVSFQERMDWTAERDAMWLAIADDPLGHREWTEADDPWQALATIFEYAGWLREGDGYVSSLPIRVDGTCNGIQHLSAMVRDPVGAAAVNLLPSDAPRDIYSEVAHELTLMLEDDKENQYAAMWLELFGDEGVPRAVTKRPVMILPYGGTRMAYIEYTRDWVEDQKFPERRRALPIDNGEYNRAIGYLIKLMWEAVAARVQKGRGVMLWLQRCSKVTAKTGLPMHWVTPAGFVVRHFYGERERKQVKTQIDGQRMDLVRWDIKATLDPVAQAKGIAPNFVHSLDASSLMTCAVLLHGMGVSAFTAIHDSFGTHAADMWTLYDAIREAFVLTYQEPVLANFLESCKDVGGAGAEWPDLPPMGSLDIEEVRKSDYFFA